MDNKDVNNLIQMLSALKEFGSDVEKFKSLFGNLGVNMDDIFASFSSNIDLIRNKISDLDKQLKYAQSQGYAGQAIELEKQLTQAKNREHYLQYGTFQGQDLYNNIDKNISTFTRAGEMIASSINKYIDFQTRIQTMQLDMIRSGWENISQGQTPFMSKSLQITTEYTKNMLEANTAQTKAITSGVMTALGTVIGVGVGVASANPVAGMMAGTTAIGTGNTIMSSVFDAMEAELKKKMADWQKLTESIGITTMGQKQFQNLNLGIGSYLALNQQNIGGGNLQTTTGSLFDLYKQYAGVPGFAPQELLPLLTQMGISRQFGQNQDVQRNMAVSSLQMGGITGLNPQEILTYFSEMRIKLGVPIDQLVNRFGSLVSISEKLEIPLRQVMSDMMELSVANNRFGFSQGVINGLYESFGKEIKEQIVSMNDLKKILQGMSQTPLEQATGMGALLGSLDIEGIIAKSGTQNPENMRRFLSVLTGTQGLDKGLFMKMVAQPNAPFNPFMEDILQQTGLSRKDLQTFQPEAIKSLLGASRMMGETGMGGGAQQYIYEFFMKFFGQELSPDLMVQGAQVKGIETLGREGGSINKITERMQDFDKHLQRIKIPLMEKEIEYQKQLSKEVGILNENLLNGIPLAEAYGKATDKINKLMKKALDDISKMITSMGGSANLPTDVQYQTGLGNFITRDFSWSYGQMYKKLSPIYEQMYPEAGIGEQKDVIDTIKEVLTQTGYKSILGTETQQRNGFYSVLIDVEGDKDVEINGLTQEVAERLRGLFNNLTSTNERNKNLWRELVNILK